MGENASSQQGRVRETVEALSDDALVQMLAASPDQYTASALEAARQELARRGGHEGIQQRRADQATQESLARAREERALAEGKCPRCEAARIARHRPLAAGIAAVLGLAVIFISLSITASQPAAGFLSVARLFAFLWTIVAGFSLFFGRNRCKACGNRWR